MASLAYLVLFLGLAHSSPIDYPEQCGYKGCPVTPSDVLNVHIVPHTHDDVGWLKTVDQYYYGSRNNIQKAGVLYIIDSVVKELWEDPKRRFIYVETAFFWKWWVQQAPATQVKVRTLVEEGRLQFVGGAWSMNDEAAAHYHSIIDQFTWGLSKINETFGPCALPRVGWQIDPFGHSREFASILAAMGYDGLFLGRIDYQDKRSRLKNKDMEMVWRGNDDIGTPSDIFTGVLYNTYSPPPGFCFDVLCNDEPIIDDPDSPMYNVDKRIDEFLSYITKQSKHYRSNNVAVTMGGDFTYQDAAMWYRNLDKLIEYVNIKSAKDNLKIKLHYSTPNCYLKAVKDANPVLPTKLDDFFPYASDPNSYWTGYFTSRPTTKYFERQGNDYLQMAKQLQVLANLEKHNMFVLNQLKSAMGVMQHHDAITGTEKQHVAHDYVRILTQAVDDSLIIARQAFNKIIHRTVPPQSPLSYNRCRLNESSCHTSEHSDKFVITLYNPLSWKVTTPVRIPVQDGKYEVYAPNGDKINSQLVDIPIQVLEIPTRESEATHELVFIAFLKPLMIKSFYIQKVKKVKREIDYNLYRNTAENEYMVDNKDLSDNLNIDLKFLEDDLMNSGYDKIEPDELSDLKNRTDFNIFADEDEIKNLKDDNGFEEHVKELVRMIKNIREVSGVSERKNYERFAEFSMEDRMMGDEPAIIDKIEDYFTLNNEVIQLQIDKFSGDVKSIHFPHQNTKLNISFHYYPACVGNNEIPVNRSSGAYIFRPNATAPTPINKTDFSVVNGHVVKEIRVSWDDNVYSTARIYNNFEYIELEYVVGPINIDDNIGKEFVVKYQTDITNNGEFYTDSNGRQVIKRKLNERPQYNVTIAEAVGGNYYPVTNNIYIENGDKRFSVITDRSAGGTSLVEGEIELMLHRRLLHDDAFGVGEALNETANGEGLVVKGTHRIMLSQANDKRKKEMKYTIESDMPPLVFVSDAKDLALADWLKIKNCYSWLKTSLPEGIHLLTLEPWGNADDNMLLIRLENYLTTSEDANLEVDLANLFNNIVVKDFKETVLSGNEWVDAYKKWTWNTETNVVPDTFNLCTITKRKDKGCLITIHPKQIRTFIVAYDFVM